MKHKSRRFNVADMKEDKRSQAWGNPLAGLGIFGASLPKMPRESKDHVVGRKSKYKVCGGGLRGLPSRPPVWVERPTLLLVVCCVLESP